MKKGEDREDDSEFEEISLEDEEGKKYTYNDLEFEEIENKDIGFQNKNTQDKDGKTALHLAIEKIEFKDANKLLDDGYVRKKDKDEHTNVNIQDNDGNSALHLALMNRADKKFIDKLINYKPYVKRKVGVTTLYAYRVEDGNEVESKSPIKQEEFQRVYSKNDAINLELKNKKGETPLHIAAANNRDDAVLKLVEKKVNVDAKDDLLGQTPLHVAATSKASKEVLETLIEHGAKVDIKDKYGKTPLHYACSAGVEDVASLIIKNGDQVIDQRNREKKDEKKKFTNLNIQDKEGNTALHLALSNKKDDIAKELINYTPTITYKEWTTEKIEKFDQFKADLTLKNKEGNTPLMLAVKNGNAELVELIINNIPKEKLNVMLNMRNKNGETTYSLASSKKVKELLENKGAYVAIKLEELKEGSAERKIQDKVNIISNKAGLIDNFLAKKGKKSALDIVQNDANLLDKDLKEARNELGKEIRSKRLKEFVTSGKISNDDVKKLKKIQETIDKARSEMRTQINSPLKNKKMKERIK